MTFEKEEEERKKNKDVRTSQSCDHVHLGTSAIQVNERDTGEQAKKKVDVFLPSTIVSFLGHFCVTHRLTHRLTESRTYIAACRS